MHYDPLIAPIPETWLAAAESHRLEGVLTSHRHLRKGVGNLQLHAAIHTVVETQLAEGYPGVGDAMARLLAEGLDRHEAIHALGTVVADCLFGMMKRHRSFDAQAYAAALAGLDARTWRASSEPD
jgi:hypothetical protein